MARRYNSQLRADGARQTREAIVAAARSLHTQGVTEVAPVAEAAGVAVATVYKHYPTKEALYEESTRGMDQPFAELRGEVEIIMGKDVRLVWGVQRLYGLYEAVSVALWTAYRLSDDSAVMAGVVEALEAHVVAIAGALARELTATQPQNSAQDVIAYVATLLHPLTYRAMRVGLGFTQQAAAARNIDTIAKVLTIRSSADPGENEDAWQF